MKRTGILPNRLKVITIILSLVIMSLAFPSCSKSGEAETITIGIPPLEQNTLIYLAEAQGLFHKKGLNVIIKDYDTGVGTINSLLSGEVDIAEAAEFPFIKPVFENQPMQIFAANDRFENDYLMVRKDGGINKAADLKGKKIGVIKGTILDFYLRRYLELDGISPKDVTIANTENTSQTTNFIVKGELDAVVAFQPHIDDIQTELGEQVLTWPVQENQLVYGILGSKDDWLKWNGDTTRRFLKSLDEADSYVRAHEVSAKKILQERMNLDSGYVASIWSQHHFSLSLDFSLIAAMTDEARWTISNNLTTETNLPDFHNYIYLDALKAVKPEAVNINP
jgi:NitT/TauT family transport system substrate-binding protein